jgi:hypothetical protein
MSPGKNALDAGGGAWMKVEVLRKGKRGTPVSAQLSMRHAKEAALILRIRKEVVEHLVKIGAGRFSIFVGKGAFAGRIRLEPDPDGLVQAMDEGRLRRFRLGKIEGLPDVHTKLLPATYEMVEVGTNGRPAVEVILPAFDGPLAPAPRKRATRRRREAPPPPPPDAKKPAAPQAPPPVAPPVLAHLPPGGIANADLVAVQGRVESLDGMILVDVENTRVQVGKKMALLTPRGARIVAALAALPHGSYLPVDRTARKVWKQPPRVFEGMINEDVRAANFALHPVGLEIINQRGVGLGISFRESER